MPRSKCLQTSVTKPILNILIVTLESSINKKSYRKFRPEKPIAQQWLEPLTLQSFPLLEMLLQSHSVCTSFYFSLVVSLAANLCNLYSHCSLCYHTLQHTCPSNSHPISQTHPALFWTSSQTLAPQRGKITFTITHNSTGRNMHTVYIHREQTAKITVHTSTPSP